MFISVKAHFSKCSFQYKFISVGTVGSGRYSDSPHCEILRLKSGLLEYRKVSNAHPEDGDQKLSILRRV